MWNRTFWDDTEYGAHLLVGDELRSSATWLEPMDARIVTLAAAPRELVQVVAVNDAGTAIAETHCEVLDFHREHRASGREEELRVFLSNGRLFCDIDWIAPRSP